MEDVTSSYPKAREVSACVAVGYDNGLAREDVRAEPPLAFVDDGAHHNTERNRVGISSTGVGVGCGNC